MSQFTNQLINPSIYQAINELTNNLSMRKYFLYKTDISKTIQELECSKYFLNTLFLF